MNFSNKGFGFMPAGFGVWRVNGLFATLKGAFFAGGGFKPDGTEGELFTFAGIEVALDDELASGLTAGAALAGTGLGTVALAGDAFGTVALDDDALSVWRIGGGKNGSFGYDEMLIAFGSCNFTMFFLAMDPFGSNLVGTPVFALTRPSDGSSSSSLDDSQTWFGSLVNTSNLTDALELAMYWSSKIQG